MRNPKVFLFDDPLSNLGAVLRSQMWIELTDLHHDLKSTMIYVTHDKVEAMTMTGRIRLIERLGADTIVHAQVDDLGPMIIHTDGQAITAKPDEAQAFQYGSG